MRAAWLGLVLAGCVEGAPTPSVSFLSPEDGDEVPVGGVGVSVIVEHFDLVPEALQHNEGEPQGHLLVALDGEEVLRTGSTTFTVAILDAGPATISAELVYDDGDPLEPPAKASIDVTAVE
jgi:hypothetical protein